MSQADKIFSYLNKFPGDWISMTSLAVISHSYNIATRISVDLNRKRGPREGWHIENKVETVGQEKHSFYRLVHRKEMIATHFETRQDKELEQP